MATNNVLIEYSCVRGTSIANQCVHTGLPDHDRLNIAWEESS